MDDRIRELGLQLGRSAIARDWPAVHILLAPWVQRTLSVEDVRDFFESEYKRTLEANDIQELHYPEYPDPQIGGNTNVTATYLREPISWAKGKVRPIPPELTDANMVYWMNLQLLCSDAQMQALDFDAFTDIWMAIAETEDGLRVGYWSHGAY